MVTSSGFHFTPSLYFMLAPWINATSYEKCESEKLIYVERNFFFKIPHFNVGFCGTLKFCYKVINAKC